MKVKCISWMRRVFVGVTVFCLTASFGTQPAQASPPATVIHGAIVHLMDVGGKLCKRKKPYTLYGDFKIHGFRNSERLIGRYGNASATISATRNKIEPGKVGRYNVQYDRIEFFDIQYYATNTGHEHMEVVIYGQYNQYLSQALPLDFDVIDCSTFGVHGTANVNEVIGNLMEGGPWEPMAMYDISGTIQAQEDGSLLGQGTVNLFIDATWTGQGWEDTTCSLLSPWEGQSTVEFEADPNAWAQEGEIDLQINLQPMQVSAPSLSCCGDGECHTSSLPGFTIAVFSLDFEPLSAESGTTDLEFHFPAGSIPIEMQLIVTPEEAES